MIKLLRRLDSNANMLPSIYYLFYQVLSKGKIIDSSHANVDFYSKTAIVKCKLTRDMTPSVRFIAYYVKPDDEVVADGLNFFIENIFENKVSIVFNKKKRCII